MFAMVVQQDNPANLKSIYILQRQLNRLMKLHLQKVDKSAGNHAAHKSEVFILTVGIWFDVYEEFEILWMNMFTL